MMKFRAVLLLALLCAPLLVAKHAHAQAKIVSSCGAQSLTVGDLAPTQFMTGTGLLCVSSSGSGGSVTITPTTGTPVEAAVTCGTSATTLLASLTATTFFAVQNPPGNANTVWVNYAGAAAVAAPPSFGLGSGSSQTWATVQGYVPTSGLSCISTPGAQAVTLSYK